MHVSKRALFLQHIAQTTKMPMMLEIARAEGMYIYDVHGRAYLDLNSGISVSSLGHRHPQVVKAIKAQVDSYMHTMVYGEHIQSPQVRFATLLSEHLSHDLDSVYFLNGGSEAVEAAIKLARRHTKRFNIVSASNAYHGSTIGAESLRSDTTFTQYFMPGLPGVKHIDFNCEDHLSIIDEDTACVILEPVQAEAGVSPPKGDYLIRLQERCNEVGALLVLDEIQTGFGRTGHLFAHQKYGVAPDILLIGKAMGGGMPISGLVAPQRIMKTFAEDPALGHITTFGGHPVPVASALASLEVLTRSGIIAEVEQKERLFHSLLVHPIIKEVRSSGLMMAVELTKRKYLKHVVNHTIEDGALIDYFLFNDRSFRLAPPLIISEAEIRKACTILLGALDKAQAHYKK